jgi:hypothetical protein
MDFIELKFPSPLLHSDNILAEAATRDFFSKFCFFIKVGVVFDRRRYDYQMIYNTYMYRQFPAIVLL